VFWRARRDARPRAEATLTGVAVGAVVLNVALGAVHVFTQVMWSWLVATHLAVASIALVVLVATIAIAAGAAAGSSNLSEARRSA
jgi:heme A synthase